MSKHLIVSMAVLAAVVVAVSFTLTSDESKPVRAKSGAVSDELEDLSTVADQMGISLQGALNRYGWHGYFSRMVSEIRSAHPGSFTTAAITGDHSASVSFSGAVPAAAQEAINDFKAIIPAVAVETHTDMGITEQEVEAAVPGAHYAVFKTEGVLDASTSFDYDIRRIEIVVQLPGTPDDPTVDSLTRIGERGAARATRPDLLEFVSVSVVVVSHELGEEESGT